MSDLQRIKPIFEQALDREGKDRCAYLDETCGKEPELRRKVEALLQAHEHAEGFLESPVFGAEISPGESPLSEGPGAIIGRYKLLEKIGEGGMAVVYMAEQQEPIHRKVALKIIKLGMDTRQVIARFEAERQALALMDHPSIAKVLDAGATETGRPYFVMELVTGVSITEYCDKNNLSTKDRLALFLQVCNAVQHAHQKGIIHRDIKPSNVMVTHHDGKPVPKVIDFGIAKATNQRLTEKTLFTRYAHLIGTPAYMSPEQAELSDLDIDTRSDIYSLGVLLYELLTGTTPFSEEELRKAGYVEMQRVIREQEPVKPSTKLSTLGETLTDVAKHRASTPDLLWKVIRGDLDWIVMKSLEKDRARRYDTASGLAEDIRRHLESEPVLARGPSSAYRLRKLLYRHRVQTVVVLTVGVLMAVVAVVLSLWSRDRLRLTEAEGFRHQGILSQAREQYAKADREAALETIKPILESKRVGVEARLLQAGILVDNRRSEEAMTILQSLLNERGEVAGAAHSLLARILWESESPNGERLKEIEEHRQKAEALLPETAEACFLRAMMAPTIKEQFAFLDKALQLDPKHYESHRLRAFTCYASRKYGPMSEEAYAMEVLCDQDPLGHSLRATALRELGRCQEAITEYDRALSLPAQDDAQYLDLTTQRCETLLRMGSYERLILDAQDALKFWPDRPIFQRYQFAALTALGQYDGAAAAFKEIIRSTPGARSALRSWAAKYVFDTLAGGRAWHPPNRQPAGAAFQPLMEAEETYRELAAKGQRITTDGFSAEWSPDGKKLAFSIGVTGNSGVGLYDPATNETDLLIVPGKYPRWSPDGRYLAFVRDRRYLRVPEFVAADPRNLPLDVKDQEVWLMRSDGTEPRRLARGVSPSWRRDSTGVYYHSSADGTLSWISILARDAEPKQIMACPGLNPSVAPDNKRVAYMEGTSLNVRDLTTGEVVGEWPLPIPSRAWGASAWSPAGNELCLGGSGMDARTGLWIYRLDRREPAQTLGGPITVGSWSPDGTKLVFELGAPHFEVWTADLAPGVPIVETLGPARTAEQHVRNLVALQSRRIAADPHDAYAYSDRARYYDYLHERAVVEVDMRRWSVAVSGQSPSDEWFGAPPAQADFTFGAPVKLDAALRFFPKSSVYVNCFSADGREMFVDSDRAGGQGRYDLWVLKRAAPEDDWGPPENLGPGVNSASGEYTSSLSGNGLELYFSSRRSGGSDLYMTRRATRTAPWGEAMSVGPKVNSEEYFENGCSVSSDGLELYLSSNRPGGYGAWDLYVSTRATTQDLWGEPVNLGPVVNGPFWQECPCLSRDGLVLLFQGYRPGGFGRVDLWMTRRASRSAPWEPPVNLGSEINGSDLNWRACLAANGSALYFARDDYAHSICTLWRAPIIPILDNEAMKP